MRKKGSVILVLLVASVFLPLFSISTVNSVHAQATEGWVNRYSYDVDYGNGSHSTTSHIGVQVFWNNETEAWESLRLEDHRDASNPHYLVRNSHITAKIGLYDGEDAVLYYDPDYTYRVCAERWNVRAHVAGGWAVLDKTFFSHEVFYNDTFINVTGIFKTWYTGIHVGWLRVSYLLRPARLLKHEVAYRNIYEGSFQHQCVMTLVGIAGSKVIHRLGESTVTLTETQIESPWLRFVNASNSKYQFLSEKLDSLGYYELNETTGEEVWVNEFLKAVRVKLVEYWGKQLVRCDIVIGNYTLAENESLLIDPDSDTWSVTASTDDGSYESNKGPTFYTNHPRFQCGRSGLYYYESAARFNEIDIAQGSTIITAYLQIRCGGDGAPTLHSTLRVEDNVDPATFSTEANYLARSWTDAVDYDETIDWLVGTTYNTANFASIVEEVIGKVGWESGKSLAVQWKPDPFEEGKLLVGQSIEGDASNPPKLYVEWTEGGGDETAPTYSDVGTNSTSAGQPCLFYTKWTDETGLATTGGYIFGTNNTGSWNNETWTAFTSNPDWSNVTKTLNATIHIRIEWQTWANDTSDNWNTTGLQGFTTIGTFPVDVTLSVSTSLTGTRELDLERSISQSVGVATSETRFGAFSRIFTQSLGVQGASSTLNDLLRSESLTLSVASSGTRTLDLERGIDVSTSVAPLGSNLLDLLRSASLSVTASPDMIQQLTLGRTTSLSVTVAPDTTRLLDLERDMDQSVSVSPLGSRILDLGRDIDLAVNLATVGSRFLDLERSISSSFTVSPDLSRIVDRPRDVSVSVAVSPDVSRELDLERDASISVSLSTVASRLLDVGRSTSLGVVVSPDFTLFLDLVRNPTLSVDVSPDTSRSLDLERDTTLAVSTSVAMDPLLDLSRLFDLSFTASPQLSRGIDLERATYLSVVVSPDLSRLLALGRDPTMSFVVSPGTSRVLDVERDIDLATTVSPDTSRELDLFRSITQAINTALNINWEWGTLLRSMSLSVAVSPDVSRLLDLGRNPILSVSVASDITNLLELERRLTSTISVNVASDPVVLFNRLFDVEVSTSPDMSRQLDLYRSISQAITTTQSLLGEHVTVLVKSMSLSIAVSPTTSRVLDLERSLALSISTLFSIVRAPEPVAPGQPGVVGLLGLSGILGLVGLVASMRRGRRDDEYYEYETQYL